MAGCSRRYLVLLLRYNRTGFLFFWVTRMKVQIVCRSCCLLAAVILFFSNSVVAQQPERPNFIFVLADDVSAEDLGCYGHPTIKTPNLDRLAEKGLRFDSAYLTISSCSPSRCSMISGRYPHNTGACELHTTLPVGQFMYPQSLKDAGYYTVLSGKNHMGPETKKAFSKISRGKGPGKEGDWVELLKQRPKDKPFFCWFASTDAHRNWNFSEEVKRYDPKEAVVPPYLIDGPLTRQDLADYYHEVSRIDFYVGKIMAELKRQKIDDQTYVIFCADNGRPFPRCKTRLYDSGIKTPLIVWHKDKVKQGATASLVSSIDICATVLELAGVPIDDRVQGVSFKKILTDPTANIRDFVFAEHNWHVFQAHERMIRYRNMVLIQNNYADRMNMCVESAPKFPSGKELWDAHDNSAKMSKAQADLFLKSRPKFELFDVSADPNQTKNLALDPAYTAIRQKMQKNLEYWSQQTGDTIPEKPTPDREDVYGKKIAGFRRGEMPGASKNAQEIKSKGPVREEPIR